MTPTHETQVLVIGAGPVGLYTALRLADAGVRVEIIDLGNRPTSASYACAVHPDVLELFDSAGIADALIAAGQRVDTVAFHDQAACRARIQLAQLPGAHPYLLVLPQAALEMALHNLLQSKHGIPVLWNHRLAQLEPKADGVLARIEELEMTAKGYIVPDFDWVVRRTHQRQVQFVVGADGRHSQVRQCLGIATEALGPAETFAFIEFNTDSPASAEVQVVIADGTVNVRWPISPHHARWTVETAGPGVSFEPEGKDRSRIHVDDPAADAACRTELLDLIERRAPWSAGGGVGEILWHSVSTFTPALAVQLGMGRCLLAGDAAHQGGLVGVHSMNNGLREAEEIAHLLSRNLEDSLAPANLEGYSVRHRAEWSNLHGPRRNESLHSKSECDHWVKHHCRRITDAVPATSLPQMDRMLGQIGLRVMPA